MYLIALKLAEVNNLLTNEQMKDFCDKFEQAIGTVEEVLKMDDYIKGISEKIKDTYLHTVQRTLLYLQQRSLDLHVYVSDRIKTCRS